MTRRGALISADPISRRQTIWHLEDGKAHIETRQDATHLVEAAKVLSEVPPDKSDGWRFMCVIPDTVFNQAAVEGWLHDKAAWRRWMNDRDNRAFNGGRENVS